MSATARAPILVVDAVSKAFVRRAALSGVSLEVRPGEIYALLGLNGAGKSTLVRAICGLTRPDAGSVRVLGKDPARERAARAAIGLAPQALALWPLLTVEENLAAFARLAGVRGAARAAAVLQAMRLADIAGQARSPVRILSGGLQRRANIAAAIVGAPGLLVLDEPTAGVDLVARDAMGETLMRLRDEGVAILVVTHDLEHAGGLADRAGFLSGGRKVLEGAPAALLQEAFGASLIVEIEVVGPQGAAAKALGAEGFLPAGAAGVWARLAPDGHRLAAEASQRLAAAGTEVREARVRKPGLADLFARLATERPAA